MSVNNSLRSRLASQGLYLRIGPFIAHLRSASSRVAEGVALHYADQILDQAPGFADFRIVLRPPGLVRRWLRPQVRFYLDGRSPFKPLPAAQAFALFEWGFNWCVAQHAHHYLMIHAAVVEQGGRALILPGAPGAGKSTLCAALVARGWRLLSDEFLLLDPNRGDITPLPRPISLKDASIQVMREFAPEVTIGREALDTTKGTVAHMKVPAESAERAQEKARPAWIVFPHFEADAELILEPLSKARSLMRISDQSFNYSMLGATGFETTADLVDRCDCYELSYGSLDQAIARLSSLALPNP